MTLSSFQMAWYGHRFAREVVLVYPVYAVMMTGAVSDFEFSTLLAFWSMSVLVAEIPSGALADRVSRVRLIVASGVIKGAGFLIWFALPNYWGFLLGFVAWGVGSTLRSGTEQALLHDTLQRFGIAYRFESIHGRAVAAGRLGTVVAFLAGGYLAERTGFALPLVLSALGPWTASIIAAVWLSEAPRSAEPERSDEAYLDTLKAGVGEAVGRPLVLRVVLMAGSLGCVWGVMDEFLPVFLAEKDAIGLFDIGIVYAVISAVDVVAATLAHRLPARTPRPVAAIFAIAGVFLALSVPTAGYVAAALLIISFAFNGAASVLLDGQLQRAIRGHARATVTSVAGTGAEVAGISLYLIGGVTAQAASWHDSVAAFAAIALLLVAAFSFGATARGE